MTLSDDLILSSVLGARFPMANVTLVTHCYPNLVSRPVSKKTGRDSTEATPEITVGGTEGPGP